MTKNYGFARRRLTSSGQSTKAFKIFDGMNSAFGRGPGTKRRAAYLSAKEGMHYTHYGTHGKSGGKIKGSNKRGKQPKNPYGWP